MDTTNRSLSVRAPLVCVAALSLLSGCRTTPPDSGRFCYYDGPAVADLPEEARSVDPDRGPYGVPWGSAPQALVARIGRPNGLIYVDPQTFLLKYGNCDLFVFKNRALTAYKLIDFSSSDFYLFFPKPGPDPNPKPFFHSPFVVELGNGVRLDMTLEQVEGLLGRKLTKHNEGRRYFLDRPKSRTTFWFGARRHNGQPVLTMVYIQSRIAGIPQIPDP